MLLIVVYYDGDVQVRRLHKNTTIKEAVKSLLHLYRNDPIGCDLFELWQDEKLIYAKERPLCD